MSTAKPPISKRPAYPRAATYYIALWGSIAIAMNFVAVDLNRRGVTEMQWSIISALRSLVVFLVTPMVTRFADRRKARVKVLQIVLVLNALSTLLFMLPNGFTGFLVVALIVNLMGAGLMPLGDSIIVRMSRRYDIQYGRVRLWGSAGYMIFGILGGLLWDRIGFEYLYWIGCIATLMVAFAASQLDEPLPENENPEMAETKSSDDTNKRSVIDILKSDIVLLLFLFAALLRASGELMFFNFAGIYIDQITDRAFFNGLIMGGAAVLEIPTMIFVQRWIRKFDLERIILAGFVVQAVGLGIFAFTFNPWIMFVGASLRNVGFALYFIATVQFVDQRAGEEDASTYQGLLSSIGWGLAPLIISPLAGWIYQQFNGQWLFIVATITSVLATVVMVPIMIRSKRETHLIENQALN